MSLELLGQRPDLLSQKFPIRAEHGLKIAPSHRAPNGMASKMHTATQLFYVCSCIVGNTKEVRRAVRAVDHSHTHTI